MCLTSRKSNIGGVLHSIGGVLQSIGGVLYRIGVDKRARIEGRLISLGHCLKQIVRTFYQ